MQQQQWRQHALLLTLAAAMMAVAISHTAAMLVRREQQLQQQLILAAAVVTTMMMTWLLLMLLVMMHMRLVTASIPGNVYSRHLLTLHRSWDCRCPGVYCSLSGAVGTVLVGRLIPSSNMVILGCESGDLIL